MNLVKLSAIILALVAGLYFGADWYYYRVLADDVATIGRSWKLGDFERVEALRRKFLFEHKHAYTRLIRLIRDEKEKREDRLLGQDLLRRLRQELADRPTTTNTQISEALEIPLHLDTDGLDAAALINLVSGKDEVYRADAALRLAELKDRDAIPALLKALESGHFETRKAAAHALGALGAKEAIDALVKALEDPVDSVSAEAARAIGLIGDPKVYQRMVRFLEDRFVPAARALGLLGDARAVDKLVPYLDKPDLEQVIVAAQALHHLGDRRGLARLEGLLVSGDEEQRVAAVRAMGELGKDSLDLLTRAVSDRSEAVRAEACASIGRIADPASLRVIVAALTDGSDRVKVAATRALAEFPIALTWPHLEKLFSARISKVRGAAAEAAVRHREGQAEPFLEGLLQDDDPDVRLIAWEGLRVLTGRAYASTRPKNTGAYSFR